MCTCKEAIPFENNRTASTVIRALLAITTGNKGTALTM